jgi:hypothetical protein
LHSLDDRLASSPFSFPATNCILIVLIAPCCRFDRYQLLYHLVALQLSFFSTLSKGYATAEIEAFFQPIIIISVYIL